MKTGLRESFEAEMRQAEEALARGETRAAWRALERAHILSQAYAWPHVRVHWAMLRFGWRQRDAREVWGQVFRLLLAAPASWLGRAPLGNTGGARVSAFQPMPIPEDLAQILAGERAVTRG